MAYVGTPIDTRNQFQSLQGKRFSGDGSTTAFTLDVAPSSTLDIEVFVGNVRQDPNSAYTLSGTTLTFTGAPPSGTNNIYVVHQAKSVGTIDVPDDIISGKTLVTLDNSADHVLIEDATDGELKKALIPAASFAGIDDQSSSNDDQLTITDTAVVINEDSDDVDFRVESNGNANMLFVSGGNDVVGIGAEGDLGSGLHVKISDASATATSNSDQVVIEKNGNCGISILSSTSTSGLVSFGDSGDNDIGQLEYNHSDNSMRFTVNGSEGMRIDTNQRLSFGKDAASTPQLLYDDNDPSFRTNVGSTSYRNHNQFKNPNGTVGSISTSGSSTSFNTSSDYRLKENVSDISDGIDRVKQLQPRRFNFIADETDTLVDGFIAHEVSNVVPEAITGTKDGMAKIYYQEDDEIPNGKQVGDFKEYSTTEIQPQAIDQAKLVPLLTKALQESITKIEALEARVTTLEG